MTEEDITLSVGRCRLVVFFHDDIKFPGLKKLKVLFRSLGRPIEECQHQNIDVTVLTNLVLNIGPPKEDRKRPVVLLSGGYLEEQISVASQYLVAIGYEVLLVRDLIDSRAPEHAPLHEQRLLHIGAFSTTMHQLLYEWIATEPNESVRKTLTKTTF